MVPCIFPGGEGEKGEGEKGEGEKVYVSGSLVCKATTPQGTV